MCCFLPAVPEERKVSFWAATQLFCYADFVVYEGKGFYSVTQAELKNSFYGLRLDMDKFSEGMYLAELTERSCPAGMEQDAVLELLYYAFLVMDRGILPPKLISRIFELKLLQLNGFFASDVCHICGEGEGTLYFDGRMGAFYCEKHRTEDSIFVLDAVRRAVPVCAGEREPRGVWLSAFRRSTRTADLSSAAIYGGSHGHKAENTRFFEQ